MARLVGVSRHPIPEDEGRDAQGLTPRGCGLALALQVAGVGMRAVGSGAATAEEALCILGDAAFDRIVTDEHLETAGGRMKGSELRQQLQDLECWFLKK